MRPWSDDFLDALRAIRRAPDFTFTAAAILALGIGANTAIFSLVDGILFREICPSRSGHASCGFSRREANRAAYRAPPPVIPRLPERASSFESLAALSSGVSMSLAAGENAPERVSGPMVTGEYFETLGIRPQIGRRRPESFRSSVVSPGFFDALGVPVLRGRGFTERDRAEGRRVAVINQAIAKEYWPRHRSDRRLDRPG